MIRSDFAGQSGHGNSAADINSYRLRQDLFSDSGSKPMVPAFPGWTSGMMRILLPSKAGLSQSIWIWAKAYGSMEVLGYLCDK